MLKNNQKKNIRKLNYKIEKLEAKDLKQEELIKNLRKEINDFKNVNKRLEKQESKALAKRLDNDNKIELLLQKIKEQKTTIA